MPFKEIADDIFTPGNLRSARDCIEPVKEIVIQVDKEVRGTKGAALTTFLSLAGKYLVLLPKNPNTGGVSRRLEGNDRMTAKKLLSEINIMIAATLCNFIFTVGPTLHIIREFFTNTICYIEHLPALSNWIGREDSDFLHDWTTFYWAWWISWSPFVGMFIARVSRGRTVTEF